MPDPTRPVRPNYRNTDLYDHDPEPCEPGGVTDLPDGPSEGWLRQTGRLKQNSRDGGTTDG